MRTAHTDNVFLVLDIDPNKLGLINTPDKITDREQIEVFMNAVDFPRNRRAEIIIERLWSGSQNYFFKAIWH